MSESKKVETILNATNQEVLSLPLRSAVKGGKSVKVDGMAKAKNARLFDWRTDYTRKNLMGTLTKGYRKEFDGSLLRIVSETTGEQVFSLCITAVGETEILRVQKDFIEAGEGVLSAEAEAERQRRLILRECLGKMSGAVELGLTYAQVEKAMVKKGEFAAEVIAEAVQVLKDREAK